MNKQTPFIFNGKLYYTETIVKIKENLRKFVGFNSSLKYIDYLIEKNVYCFSSLYNNWETYHITCEQIQDYIEDVLYESKMKIINERIEPKYIEGITSAWIWYILIMFFAVFLKRITYAIVVCVIATFIFFDWRNTKIKGG